MKTSIIKTVFSSNAVHIALSIFLTFLLMGVFFVPNAFSQEVSPATIVGWNFPDDTDTSVANLGTVQNESKEIVVVGANDAVFTFGTGSENSARATGWQDGANTKYWQIEFDTTGYEDIQLSSKQKSSATGPKDFKVQYKVGSEEDWTDVSGGGIVVGETFEVTNFQLPESTDDASSVYVRWVMTSNDAVGSTYEEIGSTGASNIDDIMVTGTAVIVEPVDTTAPTGSLWITPHYHNKETSGDNVYIEVSLNDDESYVKDVCLWLGEGEVNLMQEDFDNCKDLNEHDVYSYDYAPRFNFYNWDTTKVADGLYTLYAIATDNAGNESKIPLAIKINNTSEGSALNPSEITTCAELQAINNNFNWHYKIMNDIDCSDTKNWNGGQGFLGIGNGGNYFVGTMDGQNFHVYDIYQNVPEENSGIFNYFSGAIKNLNFRDVEIVCNSTYCGGFAQQNAGTIEKSSITGSLLCRGACGGFASQQTGIISECWGDMVIGNNGYPGGFVGHIYGGSVSNSYFKGQITADNGGGIVGLNQSSIINTYSNALINDSGFNGALIGGQSGGNQSGSYWNKEVSGLDTMCGSGSCDDSHGLTDEQMKDPTSFVGWDFESVWAIDPEKNDGYPYLQWQTSFSDQGEDESDDTSDEEVVPPASEVVKRSGGGSLMKTVAEQNSDSNDEEDEASDSETEEGDDEEEGESDSPVGNVQGAQASQFLSDLSQGMESEEVQALQEYLRSLGFFTFPTSTGYFGPITFQAVQAFQRHHNLPETGYVGPLTREKLHLGSSQGGKRPLSLSFEEMVELFVTNGIIPADRKEKALEIVALQK